MMKSVRRRAFYAIGIALPGTVALRAKHRVLHAIRGIETPLVIALAAARRRAAVASSGSRFAGKLELPDLAARRARIAHSVGTPRKTGTIDCRQPQE